MCEAAQDTVSGAEKGRLTDESKPLDSWTFGQTAIARLREEFPDRDPSANALVLFLNRASADLTTELEITVHRPRGLSWSEYRMLFVLWIAGALEPARVAELTHTSRASVSSLSTGLVARDLIHRYPSPTDKRSVLLSLTARGLSTVRQAYEAHDDCQTDLLSVLSNEEQTILRILLAKLVRSWV